MTPLVAEKEPEATERPRRDPQVRAGQCRACGSWNTKIYRTLKIIRYCRCKTCGNTWTQSPQGNH